MDRLFTFFFFKQKTAYEIVDCDWSSDVCSSDLYPHLRLAIVFVKHHDFDVVGAHGAGESQLS